MFEFLKSKPQNAAAGLLQDATPATPGASLEAKPQEVRSAVKPSDSLGVMDAKQALDIFEKIQSLLGKLPEWGIKLPQPILKYGIPTVFILVAVGSFAPQFIAAKSVAAFFANPELYTQLVLLFGSGAFAKLFYNMTEANRELIKNQNEIEQNGPKHSSQPNLRILQQQLQELRNSNQLKEALLMSKDCSLDVRMHALRLSFDLLDSITSSMSKSDKVSTLVPFFVELLKTPGMKEDQLRDIILDKLSKLELSAHPEIRSACGALDIPEIVITDTDREKSTDQVTRSSKILELRSYLRKSPEVTDRKIQEIADAEQQEWTKLSL